MAYAVQHDTRQKIATFCAVASLHAAAGYALIVGLAAAGIIEPPPSPFEGSNITVTVPLDPPPPTPEDTNPVRDHQQSVITPVSDFNLSPVALPDINTITESKMDGTIFIPPIDPPSAYSPEPARPRNDPGQWVTDADYSSRAMRMGMEGVTRFTLTIDRNGRVSGCRVTASSGHAELDDTTCKLLAKRARFDPARDGDGKKAIGSYSSAVRWQIRN